VLRVGLTGGIACGKSRIRRQLAAAGFGTLDLDAVAHELIAPAGAAYADVVDAFGRDILAPDGAVDRKALGARVFADAEARARLNALVHPRVREEEARRAAAHAAAGGRVFVTDAALLVEAGMHLRFDRLVVVDCEGSEQLRRLMARDGLPEPAARSRIAAQMPAVEKRRFAHVVVDASGTLEATDAHAAALAAALASLAEDAPPRPPLPEASVAAALAAGPRTGPRGVDPERWVADVAAAGPEALAVVVGLWSRGRRGLDAEFTAAAMFSTAYLVERDAARIAGACLLAVAATHIASGLGVRPEERAAWTGVAERWAQGPVPAGAQATVEAALGHAGVAETAATAAGALGGDPRVAAALAAAAR
jgi:dephospho-CoA kinase